MQIYKAPIGAPFALLQITHAVGKDDTVPRAYRESNPGAGVTSVEFLVGVRHGGEACTSTNLNEGYSAQRP